MTLKDIVVVFFPFCLLGKVTLSNGEVILVNRNFVDSFRVGKEGCTNNACTSSATCETDSGLCLCSVGKPTYRNPVVKFTDGKIVYGDTNDCIVSDLVRFGVGTHCSLGPFQVIPYSHKDSAKQFSHDNPKVALQSCTLTKALAKFPDNDTEMDLQWLNEYFVDLTILNKTLHFKWKRSVPDLQGTIITFSIYCRLDSSTYLTTCIRAKVLGTWHQDAVSVPTEPTAPSTEPKSSQITSNVPTEPIVTSTKPKSSKITSNVPTKPRVTSTQPKSSQITSKTTSSVKVTTVKPKSTSSDECGSDSNTTLIAVLAISLVVNVVLGSVIGFMCKKQQRNQRKNLKAKEMQGGHRQANSGNEMHPYDEVVIDKSFMSSGRNNYGHSPGKSGNDIIDQIYEEPSNYQPLKRNNLQDLSEEHKYQDLTTLQKGK